MPHVVTRPGLVAGARIAALLAVVHAANDVLMAFVGVLLPSIRSTFDASPTALAVLVAVFTVSASATQPIIGTVAERLGLRRVLAVGVALGAVAMSLLGVAPSLGVLVLLLAVGGLGSAALHPAAMSVVGSPAAVNPGLAVGLFTAGGMVGFASGPALLLWFVRGHGLEQSYWLMLPGLLAAALLWWGLPDWEPHTPNPRSGWQALMNAAPRLRWLLVVSVLVNLAFVTVTSTVPLWLVDSHGVATEGALLGWVLGAFSVAAGAGAVLGGALGGRLGYRTTGVVSLLLAAPVLAVLVVVPVGARTLAAAALLGGLAYVSQPLLVVRAQELVPAAPVAATGVVVGLGTGIAGGLYVAVGAVQELIGLRNSLLLTSLLLAAAAAAAYRALPGKAAAPAPEDGKRTDRGQPADPVPGQVHQPDKPREGGREGHDPAREVHVGRSCVVGGHAEGVGASHVVDLGDVFDRGWGPAEAVLGEVCQQDAGDRRDVMGVEPGQQLLR